MKWSESKNLKKVLSMTFIVNLTRKLLIITWKKLIKLKITVMRPHKVLLLQLKKERRFWNHKLKVLKSVLTNWWMNFPKILPTWRLHWLNRLLFHSWKDSAKLTRLNACKLMRIKAQQKELKVQVLFKFIFRWIPYQLTRKPNHKIKQSDINQNQIRAR